MSHRVRIPEDRNLAAGARRCAITPDELLITAYKHRQPDFVHVLEGGLSRNFFLMPDSDDQMACYVQEEMVKRGVTLPSVGDEIFLVTPLDYVQNRSRGFTIVVVGARKNDCASVARGERVLRNGDSS